MTGDPSTTAKPARSPRRTLARVGLALGLLVGSVGLAAWLARDLPRRWLERRLAVALDAEVDLGRLEIESPRRFVLVDLVISAPGWEPRLHRVAIDRLQVEAGLREVRSDRVDRIEADGVSVVLGPPEAPVRPAPESSVRVGELVLRRGRIEVGGPTGAAALDFTASLRDWGAEPHGEVSLRAERIDLAPWLALAGGGTSAIGAASGSTRIDVQLERGLDSVRLTARGERLEIGSDARRISLPGWTLEATAQRDDGSGPLRVQVRPRLPGIETALIEARLDPETFAIEQGHAALSGIDLASLLATGEIFPRGATIEGTGALEGSTEDGSAFEGRVNAAIERLELPVGSGRIATGAIELTASADWGPRTRRLAYTFEAGVRTATVHAADLDVEGATCEVRGSGELDPDRGAGPLRIDARVPSGDARIGGASIGDATLPLELSLAGDLAVRPDPGFSGTARAKTPGAGALEATGTASWVDAGGTADLRWSWEAPRLAELAERAAATGVGSLPAWLVVDGRPHAAGTLAGRLADPDLRGTLRIERLEIAADVDTGTLDHGRWTAASDAVRVVASRRSGDGGRLSLESFELRGDLRHAGPGEAWTRPLACALRGTFDAGSGEATVDQASVELVDLARATLRGRFGLDGAADGTVALDPLELGRLREAARLWIVDPAPDYALTGTVGASFDVDRETDGHLAARGNLQLDRAGFSSSDGARVIDGVAAKLALDLGGDPDGELDGHGSVELTGPLVLWGAWFGDYSAVVSHLDAGFGRSGDAWRSTLEWTLPGEVRLNARLAWPPPGTSGAIGYALGAAVPDLGRFLDDFVRGPFEGSVAGIDSLRASGNLKVDLEGELDGSRRTLRGNVAVADASFAGIGQDGDTSIGGLDLDLPLDLTWDGASPSPRGPEHEGSLVVESLRLSGLDFPPVRTPLAVAGDTVRLDRPLRLVLLGGHVELERLALVDWSGPSRHARFGMRLDNLDLDALGQALDLFPLEGRVNGSFPSVRLTPERLEVDGGGGIDVFGGHVEVFDISGREVLGRYPRYEFSARFDGIRLLDVTRTVDFGEIEGVVRGDIRDCELFRGTPVRCAAEFESVKTPGVHQRISVKAIRNISILGAGGRVGLLDRGLQKFFDRYNYAAIGVEMTLRNDRFLLRGTAKRGDKELFVKGRFPFRIDIVNVAPGHSVSFQSMLGRLGNLEVRPTPPPEKGADRPHPR